MIKIIFNLLQQQVASSKEIGIRASNMVLDTKLIQMDLRKRENGRMEK